MKKRFSLWAVCWLLASVFVLPQAAQAQCNATTLTGPWAYLLAAGFSPNPGEPLNVVDITNVSLGTLVADGAGNFTDTDSTLYFFYFLGSPFDRFATDGGYGVHSNGTYTVNANCTGTLTFHVNNLSVHFDFVLLNGGTGPNTAMYLIASDSTILNVVAGRAAHL